MKAMYGQAVQPNGQAQAVGIDIGGAASLILAAIVSTIIGAIYAFKKTIKAYIDVLTNRVAKGRQKHATGVQNIYSTYAAIEQMGLFENVDRIVVFAGTNCGGVPDPKKPYTVKPIYRWPIGAGTAEGNVKKLEELYNAELRVDAHYMKVICELIEKGWVEIITKDLPENAMMKRYLKQEDVYQSRLYQLHMDERQLTFISIASKTREFTGDEMDAINIKVDRIRSLMSKTEE